MRRHMGMLVMAVLCAGPLAAQTSSSGGGAQASNAKTNPWQYNLSVSGTIVAHGPSFVSPVFTADHDWLHLEGRYNYEAQHTGSLWVGYDFNVGKKVTLEATPMLGGVFGHVTGVAPGWNSQRPTKNGNCIALTSIVSTRIRERRVFSIPGHS